MSLGKARSFSGISSLIKFCKKQNVFKKVLQDFFSTKQLRKLPHHFFELVQDLQVELEEEV